MAGQLTTADELHLYVDTVQERLGAVITAVAAAVSLIPELRQVLRTLQRVDPASAAKVEAALALVDIIDWTAQKMAALGRLAREHGVVP